MENIVIKKQKSEDTGKILKNWYALYVDSFIWTENLSFNDGEWCFYSSAYSKISGNEGSKFVSLSNIDLIITYFENLYRLERHKSIATAINKSTLQSLYNTKNILLEIKDINTEDITEIRNKDIKEKRHPST